MASVVTSIYRLVPMCQVLLCFESLWISFLKIFKHFLCVPCTWLVLCLKGSCDHIVLTGKTQAYPLSPQLISNLTYIYKVPFAMQPNIITGRQGTKMMESKFCRHGPPWRTRNTPTQKPQSFAELTRVLSPILRTAIIHRMSTMSQEMHKKLCLFCISFLGVGGSLPWHIKKTVKTADWLGNQ
jgi:hypothetical protein